MAASLANLIGIPLTQWRGTVRCDVGSIAVKQENAQLRVVADELGHRIKNLVAIIQSIVRQTMHQTTTKATREPCLEIVLGASRFGGRNPRQRQSIRNGPHQIVDPYRREIREGVGYRVGQNNLPSVAHGAAGVDDVGHIAFALCRLGANEGFAQAGDNLRWVFLVEQNRADRVFATGPTPWVSSSQPSSSSIGDPQLPICTNSQGYSG